MPNLYIITGSNGAGKSTIGSIYLPVAIRKICQVFDGDKLFLQKQRALWQQGIIAIKEARKLAYEYVSNLFEELVNQSIESRDDFAYEGHFTNEATWDVPKRYKNSGYTIHLIYLGLENVALSESRVLERISHGGHYVQPSEIETNFYGNLEKLNKYYPLFNTVVIVDTSEPKHKVLTYLENGVVINSINKQELPNWFIVGLPNIYQDIIKQ